MGIFDFVKDVGERLFGGGKGPDTEALKKEVAKYGLPIDGLDVSVEGDTVKVAGTAPSREVMEKVVLALGNVAGVAKVEEAITVTGGGVEATFYTVKAGDTLSAIAKAQYGDANKYMLIFEANKPMLSDPNKIYPGQSLRIPKLG